MGYWLPVESWWRATGWVCLLGTIEARDCFGEGIFLTCGTLITSATVIAEDKIIAAECTSP